MQILAAGLIAFLVAGQKDVVLGLAYRKLAWRGIDRADRFALTGGVAARTVRR